MSATATVTPTQDQPVHQEGIKDTIESIVVALILAFVFRAFIVEAFVIPTGSMAPTLYGAHGTVVCEDCGVEFAYGLIDPDEGRRGLAVNASAHVTCPNCGHDNTNLKINDISGNAEKGDRILVLKWPFDFGGPALDPQRWDVVVFKDPSDGVTNFIKRLAGLPNEVLMIIDGDVYSAHVDDLSDVTLTELERYRHEKYEHRIHKSLGRLQPVAKVVLDELDEKLKIRRKTPTAQKVLWTTVYNNDFPPRTRDAGQPYWARRWGGDTGWSDLDKRRIRFDDKQRPGDFILLKGKRVVASNAYNVRDGFKPPPVSDMRLRMVWTPLTDDAAVMIRMSKYAKTFWASYRADGHVALYNSQEEPDDTALVMGEAQLPPFEVGEPVMLSFENVDYRLAVRVRDEEVLASSDDPDSDAYYGPSVAFLRRQSAGHWRQSPPDAIPPRLFGEGGSFEVTHLVVDRDIYYYRNERVAGLPAAPWAPDEGWGSEVSPILLRSYEFFMLGDNTAASKDSRLWDVEGPHLVDRGEGFQLGTVPRDQLIGKAFFVYWPAGHRLSWLPLPKSTRSASSPTSAGCAGSADPRPPGNDPGRRRNPTAFHNVFTAIARPARLHPPASSLDPVATRRLDRGSINDRQMATCGRGISKTCPRGVRTGKLGKLPRLGQPELYPQCQ